VKRAQGVEENGPIRELQGELAIRGFHHPVQLRIAHHLQGACAKPRNCGQGHRQLERPAEGINILGIDMLGRVVDEIPDGVDRDFPDESEPSQVWHLISIRLAAPAPAIFSIEMVGGRTDIDTPA
jgi:hypothetical protein